MGRCENQMALLNAVLKSLQVKALLVSDGKKSSTCEITFEYRRKYFTEGP